MFKEFLEFPFPDKWWFVLLMVWVAVWKGMALWKSSRLGQKWWFVILFFVNTFGILEIFYIHVFSKKRQVQQGRHDNGNHHNQKSDDRDHDATAHGVSASLINLEDAEPVEEEKSEVKPAKVGEEKPEGSGNLA